MDVDLDSSLMPGLGLRPEHYPFLREKPPISAKWFEAISENYMDSYGQPREMLHFIRRDFPVALHGVSMSLLSAEGIRPGYLKTLKNLVDEIEPFIISDHLCWTGTHASNIHDLLPFPFTQEAFSIACANIDKVQNFLGRAFLIENVSTYLSFENNAWSEWEFIVQLAEHSGAQILLDINNIYVNSCNHNFSPEVYIDYIPSSLVAEVHLAGFSDMGDYLFDTHSNPVWPDVWKLFARFMKKNPKIPFMIEWDEDIPKYQELEWELSKGIDICRQFIPHNEAKEKEEKCRIKSK